MTPVLLTDFGSTNTKVTAVDLDEKRLLGTATAFTTVETDVGEGQEAALALLEKKCGPLTFARRFACSSAAGGLRMIACGLVPSLTAEAARLACLGAGAKVVKVYSYQLTEEDIEEIEQSPPDIFLLTGGTDGGNKETILHNAQMMGSCRGNFPIILAGNRSVASKCRELLKEKLVISCPNVMPQFGKLNIEPVQAEIRKLFLDRIIQAKGLSSQQSLVSGILMPTPAAVLRAMELLAYGIKDKGGVGDLVAVDLGGATTDVYSIADGLPETDGILLKGLPEPRSKRTVEGDIGMRYSAAGVLEAAGIEQLSELSGIEEERVAQMVDALGNDPGALPRTPEEEALDFSLAASAVEIGVRRHAGTMEQIYTLAGPALAQTGKDLRRVTRLILTGGAVIHNTSAGQIGAFACYSEREPMSLRPKGADIYVDKSYILSAMGLLAEEYPEVALAIMTKEIIPYGTAE